MENLIEQITSVIGHSFDDFNQLKVYNEYEVKSVELLETKLAGSTDFTVYIVAFEVDTDNPMRKGVRKIQIDNSCGVFEFFDFV